MASVSILPFVEDQQVIYRGYIKTNIVDKLNVRPLEGKKKGLGVRGFRIASSPKSCEIL